MSGSWEIDRRSVIVATLHTDVTTVYWALGLRRLQWPGPFQDPLLLCGMPYDHSRNAAVQHMLTVGAEWIFFLDSDVVPPRDAIYRLLAHNQPFISGMYCRRSPPAAVPVMMKNGTWFTDFKLGSVVEVDVVGAGCLLIHRSVFERTPHQRPGHPWFDWRVNLQGHLPREKCLSEDFTFCRHYIEHGGHVLVDTSVRCKHIGYAESDFEQFGPVGSTQVA